MVLYCCLDCIDLSAKYCRIAFVQQASLHMSGLPLQGRPCASRFLPTNRWPSATCDKILASRICREWTSFFCPRFAYCQIGLMDRFSALLNDHCDTLGVFLFFAGEVGYRTNIKSFFVQSSYLFDGIRQVPQSQYTAPLIEYLIQ